MALEATGGEWQVGDEGEMLDPPTLTHFACAQEFQDLDLLFRRGTKQHGTFLCICANEQAIEMLSRVFLKGLSLRFELCCCLYVCSPTASTDNNDTTATTTTTTNNNNDSSSSNNNHQSRGGN